MATLVLGQRKHIGEAARVDAARTARDPSRLGWVDAIRGLLAVLVVAHHAGQPYGGGGDWPVLETVRSSALGPFFSVNAAFFMGLFFLISGYFLPGSYDRKGGGAFLRDRLFRFGAPLLVFGLAAFGPITYLDYRDDGGQRAFWPFFVHDYLGEWQVELGHLWFLAHLLVYAAAYAAWRRLAGPGAPRVGANGWIPGHRSLVVYTVALAAVTYAVRIEFPVDHWERLIVVVPSELAHLPQYLSLFIVGLVAARGDWLRRFPTTTGMVWLRIGLGAAILRYAYTLWPGEQPPGIIAKGGADWRSLVWSAWEAAICVGLCVGLLVLAREWAPRPNRLLSTLSANAYAVYIMHIWVLVPLQFALVDVPLAPLTKFALVTLAGIPLSVAVAALARRPLPLRRVL